MGFIKFSIQFLIMRINLIFLVKFNMPTHYNNGLTHKEHKNASNNGQNEYGNTTKGN